MRSGRDELRERVRVAIQRTRLGRPAKSVIMVGLRGVGKTVLLNQMFKEAEAADICAIYIDAHENQSLPAILTPQLRMSLLCLSCFEAAKDSAVPGLNALTGFSKDLKVKFGDIELRVDYDLELGLADNDYLESDLTTLLVEIGRAARSAKTALVIFIDELQFLKEEEIASLMTALHRVSQLGLPVMLIGTGLPQLRGRAGNAKSYAERLFDYPVIGP